jgi:hypothetical protein
LRRQTAKNLSAKVGADGALTDEREEPIRGASVPERFSFDFST